MKKIAISYIFLSINLYAAPGCLDNSVHLTQQHDTKAYHTVICNCPCEKAYKIIADRARCPKCQHYRDPKYTSIVSQQRCTPKHTPSAINFNALALYQQPVRSITTNI